MYYKVMQQRVVLFDHHEFCSIKVFYTDVMIITVILEQTLSVSAFWCSGAHDSVLFIMLRSNSAREYSCC